MNILGVGCHIQSWCGCQIQIKIKIIQVRFATYRAAVLASRSGGEGSAAEVIMMIMMVMRLVMIIMMIMVNMVHDHGTAV